MILHVLFYTMFYKISSFSFTMAQEIVCARAASAHFEARETLLAYKSICMNLLEGTKKLDTGNSNLTRHISRATRELELCKEEIESILGPKNTNISKNFNTVLNRSWARSLGIIRGIECLIQPYTHEWITIPQEAERRLYNFYLDLQELYVELCLVRCLSFLIVHARSRCPRIFVQRKSDVQAVLMSRPAFVST